MDDAVHAKFQTNHDSIFFTILFSAVVQSITTTHFQSNALSNAFPYQEADQKANESTNKDANTNAFHGPHYTFSELYTNTRSITSTYSTTNT